MATPIDSKTKQIMYLYLRRHTHICVHTFSKPNAINRNENKNKQTTNNDEMRQWIESTTFVYKIYSYCLVMYGEWSHIRWMNKPDETMFVYRFSFRTYLYLCSLTKELIKFQVREKLKEKERKNDSKSTVRKLISKTNKMKSTPLLLSPAVKSLHWP